MDISLVRGSSTIVLNGTGAGVPLRGARFADGRTIGGELELELALDGTPAQITAWIQALDLSLAAAGRAYGYPGEDWGYLQVTLNGETWRTPVIFGWIEYASAGGAAPRAAGSQGVRVKVKREDWWEAVNPASAPLTNRNGTDVTTGLNGSNHSDSGDDNFFKISSMGVSGILPAPAVVQVTTSVNGSEFLIGQAVTSDTDATYVLEAESGTLGSGVGGSPTADGNCSNGNYRPLSWSGSGAVNLLYWGLSTAATKQYRGRMFRPVLRLRDLISGSEKFWLWWRLAYGSEVFYEGEGVMCPTDWRLVMCPPLAIPPWPKGDSAWSWEAVTVQLMCQAEGTGSHTLNLDFVQNLPVEGWLRFIPVISGLTGSQVVYDTTTGAMTRTSTVAASHAAEGSGLWVYPGVNQTFYILSHVPSTGAMAIATVNNLKVMYRKRARAL